MKLRTVKARNSVVAILFAIFFVFGICASSAYADEGLKVTSHTKTEIIYYLKNSGVTVNDVVSFSVEPLKNTEKGELTQESKNSALKMLNNVRYIAGLDAVNLDATYGRKAQAGAFANYVVGMLTHYPGKVDGKPEKEDIAKPTGMSDVDWAEGKEGAKSSNIGSGYSNLNSAIVYGWMSDDDMYNIARIGHRAWCINPKMGATGFGKAGGYTAMWSTDSTGTGTQTNVAWPARYMPIEYFSKNDPWSLFTGNTSITQMPSVSVSLTRRSESTSGFGAWTFSTSQTYTETDTGEYFTVQVNNPYHGYYGLAGAYVVFRPADITYRAGDIFDVSITGLGSSTITYTVEFFSGYPVETATFDKQEYTLTSTYSTIKPTVTPASASGYEVIYTSSNESVVTVDERGVIRKEGMGEATITATIDGRFTSSGNPITASYVVKVPKSITSSDISVSYTRTVYYTGKKADLNLVVTDNGTELVEGVDYIAEIPEDAIRPRMSGDSYTNYTMTIKGIGNYYGNKYNNFFWIYKQPLSRCTIVLSPSSAEYTGSQQIPGVEVYNGELKMTEGVDYTITANNGGTKAGNYAVNVKAVSTSDCYSGSAQTTFSITQKEITEDMIDDIATVTYSGIAQAPDVSVHNGSTTLLKNTDYTVSYSQNIGVGTATATIVGKGNYKGTISKSFTINPKTLTSSMISFDATSFEYDGSNQKPVVTVKDGNKTLVAGTDYDLTNDGGVDAGEYSASITGKGNYAGNISGTFTISPKSIADVSVSLDRESVEYTGSSQKPVVTVKDGTKTLVLDVNYALINNGGTDVGEYTVVVTGQGNYTGSVTEAFIINAKQLTDDMVSDISSVIYDGSEKEPAVDVPGLTISADYEVTYSSNTNVGTATATVTGKGNYGGSVTKEFNIAPKPLEESMIDSIEDVEFNGAAHSPGVVVKDGEKELFLGVDYTVSYEKNVNAGTAAAAIYGMGNYSGRIEKPFTITPKELSEEMVGVIEDEVYTGDYLTPRPAVKDGEISLAKGKDYEITYKDNVEEGEATACIEGKGNYKGTIIRKFNVVSEARKELEELIAALEEERNASDDQEFKDELSTAIEQAQAALDNGADKDQLSEARSALLTASTSAREAMQERKAAAEQAAQEQAEREAAEREAQEKAKKEAEEKAAAEKAARAVQKGSDGTALGKGASAEAAEVAILKSASEEGPSGSKFAGLQLRSTKQSNTSVTLAWTKPSGTAKVVIYGNACGKNKKMVKLGESKSKSITYKKVAGKAVKKGTYYKFLVVALDSKNNVISSSKVVHVATKGGKVGNPTKITHKKPKTLKKGKTFKLAAKQSGSKIKKHRVLKYETSNAKVATVSAKGVIKAQGKGSCYIYIYAQNGLFKKVKVTVK